MAVVKRVAVTAGAAVAAFLLAAAGFSAGVAAYFRLADYRARRRETAAQTEGTRS